MYSRLRRRTDFRPARNFIYRAHWPRLLCFKSISRPSQRTRPLTSYPVSQSRVLPTHHEAGHVFSPTSEVGNAFFQNSRLLYSSPCLADPAWLSVVGFVDCKLPASITPGRRILTSSPVSQSRVFPTSHEAGHVVSPTRSRSKSHDSPNRKVGNGRKIRPGHEADRHL